MDLPDRIGRLLERIDVLHERFDKAARRSGKPRIPGDGDGDGIPHEGRKKPTGSPVKAMTFIQVLNDERGRQMVDGIEDTISSLRGKQGDRILEGVLRSQIKQLKDTTGYLYRTDVLG